MSIKINSIKYKILKELTKDKKDGMKIYQVLNKKDDKNYVIKEISIKNEKNEIINIIEKEAEILSKFNHDNIVKYYGSSKTKEYFYILMEYCDSNDLRYFIKEQKDKSQLIEENNLYNIIMQICLGIKEIHDKNIIHRDLKPENIFLNKKYEVKIGDFGISKEFFSYKQYTVTQNKQGTLHYAPPEILTGGKYNKKADIWSLGCIIYELLTLRIYYKDNIYDDIAKIDNTIYNDKWQRLIDSLLEKQFDKRPDINTVINFLITIIGKEIDENSNYNLNNNIKIPKKLGRYEIILSNDKNLKTIYSK